MTAPSRFDEDQQHVRSFEPRKAVVQIRRGAKPWRDGSGAEHREDEAHLTQVRWGHRVGEGHHRRRLRRQLLGSKDHEQQSCGGAERATRHGPLHRRCEPLQRDTRSDEHRHDHGDERSTGESEEPRRCGAGEHRRYIAKVL